MNHTKDSNISTSDECLKQRLRSDAIKFFELNTFEGQIFYLSSANYGQFYNKALLAKRIDNAKGVLVFLLIL